MFGWFKRVAPSVSDAQPWVTEAPAGSAEDEIKPAFAQVDRFRRPTGGVVRAPGTTQVIVVTSQKGGTGKTTISAHLAVEAAMQGDGPVVLIDTDPQGSLGQWWEARDDERVRCEGISALVGVRLNDLASRLAELRDSGVRIAIIDTPPAHNTSIEQAIAMADLVVIPSRPSPHDLRAIGATVNMTRSARKPYFFVVNGAAPRAHITAQAIAALSEHGRVVPVILYQRTNYASAMIDGRTVMETTAPARSADEVGQLWKYLQSQMIICRQAA